MKFEIYCNHLIIYAINHYNNKEFHIYNSAGLRIVDSAITIEAARRLIDQENKKET